MSLYFIIITTLTELMEFMLCHFLKGIIGTSSGTLWYVNWDERTSIRLVSGHAQKVSIASLKDL